MNIESDFLDAIKHLYSQKLLALQNGKLPAGRSAVMKHNMVQKRLNETLQEIGRVIKVLHTLPYHSFGVRECDNDIYLVGVSKKVYIAYELDNWFSFENLGEYVVAIPIASIIKQSLNRFHFIPYQNLLTQDRHYHHIASRGRILKNPLQMTPETCWASVGAMMLGALSLCDVAAIFETAYMFLTRVDYFDRLDIPEHHSRISQKAYLEATGLTVVTLSQMKYPDVPF